MALFTQRKGSCFLFSFVVIIYQFKSPRGKLKVKGVTVGEWRLRGAGGMEEEKERERSASRAIS